MFDGYHFGSLKFYDEMITFGMGGVGWGWAMNLRIGQSRVTYMELVAAGCLEWDEMWDEMWNEMRDEMWPTSHNKPSMWRTLSQKQHSCLGRDFCFCCWEHLEIFFNLIHVCKRIS